MIRNFFASLLALTAFCAVLGPPLLLASPFIALYALGFALVSGISLCLLPAFALLDRAFALLCRFLFKPKTVRVKVSSQIRLAE